MSADFIDTNVFIYTFDAEDVRKRTLARELISEAIEHASGVISHQVVQETLNVLTRKARRQMAAPIADRFFAEMLAPLWHASPRHETYLRALRVQSRYGYAFYDSLIIAAALEAGCDRLLSEDLQHGQQIEGLRIEDPFR